MSFWDLTERFNILVFPLAFVKSNLNIFISPKIRREPVPGPKNPS